MYIYLWSNQITSNIDTTSNLMNKILIIFLKDNLYQLLLCVCANIWNLLFYRSYSISRFVCLSIRPKGERVHCPKSIFSVMPWELKDTLVVFFLAAIRDRCMELRMKITITIKKSTLCVHMFGSTFQLKK